MSDELVRRIEAAASAYEFPATPALADRVGARLERAPRRRPSARPVAVAVALGACAALFAFADGARSAALDLFDLVPGISIERTEGLPRAAPLLVSERDFGRPVPLAAAVKEAGFPVRLPRDLDAPDAVYLDRGPAVTAVTAVWNLDGGRASVILTQWHPARLLFRKLLLSPDTVVEVVQVDGTRGLWIRGEEHELFYLGADGRSRRAAPVLVGHVLAWEREGIVHRIEGNVSLERALGLARLELRS